MICRSGHPDYPSVPAHSNFWRDGKGKSMKAHDCMHVPACPPCHAELDTGKMGREAKQTAFDNAWREYMVWLWVNGLVCVKKGLA